MTLRVLWGLCLGVAAMVTGVGIELYGSGAGAMVSYPIVIAGILLVPLASAGIERLTPATTASRD